MNVFKKAFTMGVVLTTILWSVGVSALVPTAVKAATVGDEVTCSKIEAGDMIKLHGGAAIYLVNSDMTRSFFPNGDVFKSWNTGDKYSDYLFVTSDCMSSFKTAGAVMPRPGSFLVKEAGSDTTYAVLPGNVLAKASGDAVKMYGTRVLSMDPASWGYYFTNGATGAALTEAQPHEGMLVKVGTTYYYVAANNTLRKITSEGLTANRFKTAYAYTLTSTTGYTMGDDVNAEETALSDRSQGAKGGSTTGTGTTVVDGGSVGISLSANTPEAGNVVINVDNVVFSKFVFKAGSDKDVTVNSVKIIRKGLGSKDDFVGITLYDGATKLGSTKSSWNSDSTMTYNISGGWKIPAGTSKELTVTAKLDTSGTYNALGISEVTGLGLDTAGLPVYGNQMSGVNVTVGTVTITNTGTDATKKIGTNAVTLAQFKVALDDKEDGKFESVILKDKGVGSNDGNVASLYLYQGSTVLAGPVKMIDKKVTFVLDNPYKIEKSKNQTFKVVGDIVDGATDHVNLVLDNSSDLKVLGSVYSTYLSVINTNYNDAGEGATISIDGAELNVAYSGNNLDTVDDKDDVEFGKITMSAGSTDIKVTEMGLRVVESGDSSIKDLTDLELVDETTGAAYSFDLKSGTGGDSDADAETWTTSDEIYLSAGETHTFLVRADIEAGVANNVTYKVTMTLNTSANDAGYIIAETVPAGDTVTNFSIGSFVGKTVTIKTPTLKVSGVTQNDGTAVVNDENVVLFKGTLEASADDVSISRAVFVANTAFSTDNWTEIGFYLVNSDGSYTTKQTINKSSMTSGTVDFDSLDITVKNGVTNKVTYVVKGKVAATLNANVTKQGLKLDFVTAKDSENNDADVEDTAGNDLSTSAGSYLTDGARRVDLSDKGKLYIQMVNNVSGYDKDRVVLAGSSLFVGKLKLRADNEAAKVKDMVMTNTATNTGTPVNTLCLYSSETVSDTNLVACATVGTDGKASFKNLNREVAQGTSYWYLYANTKSMDNTSNGTARTGDTVKFVLDPSVTDGLNVEGVRSGYTYTAATPGDSVGMGEYAFDTDADEIYNESGENKTGVTKSFYLAGTKISNVALVDSYGGKSLDTSLSGTGDYTVAILAVTIDNTSNTDNDGNALKAKLKTVRFDIDKAANTAFDSATIERINGTDGAKSLATTTALLSGDLSSLMSNDYKIDPGTVAYFVVKMHVSSVDATSNYTNYVRVKLTDLKGTYNTDADNNIDWNDGYTNTNVSGWSSGISPDFNALLLDTTSLDGTKISKTNS